MKLVGKAVTYWGSVAFDAWVLMFALAAFDFPTAYWKCLLAAYAVACMLGTGIYGGAVAVINNLKDDE